VSGLVRRAGRSAFRVPLAAGLLVALLSGGLAFFEAIRTPVSGTTSLAGSAGTNTALPATDSQVTVSGRGQFSNLRVTVNQTTNLTNQAVSLSWSGADPTYSTAATATAPATFKGSYAGNYLQIFQCWGDDDGTNPANPGPPPEQCEFGGENNNQTAYPIQGAVHAYERVVAAQGWTCGSGSSASCVSYTQAVADAATQPGKFFLDPNSSYVLDPFKAVDGTTIGSSVNYAYTTTNPPSPYDTNPYFNYNTTNELDLARTYDDGTGHELFQAFTGLEAPGLGCGQDLQALADGTTKIPSCWLVVVPRATPDTENLAGDPINPPVVDTSPLTPSVWQNRIAIKLGFTPIGSSCDQNVDASQVQGSELAGAAAASWEPALCAQSSASRYTYVAQSDDQARSQMAIDGSGMYVVTRPADQPSGQTPVVTYAPLTLSGVVVAFNVQRLPALDAASLPLADEVPFQGSRVVHINLTPRLVAKLLTQSYRSALYGLRASALPAAYSWIGQNPVSLASDPDFQQFNPEFTELRTVNYVQAANLVTEAGYSDSAYEVWQWILSDPEAQSWMAGNADPWGMKVNPYYGTQATYNVNGVTFGTPAVSNFPKSDPYCWSPPSNDTIQGQLARNLCAGDWAPYVLDMKSAAAAARAANSGSKTTFNPFASSKDTAWSSDGPQLPGTDYVLALTDTPHAAVLGLQTASLSRAGDDGATREFVAADSGGLLAGEKAMKVSPVAGVVVPNPASTMPGAYPLAMLTYGAVVPAQLSDTARAAYRAFLTFAVGSGQTPGAAAGNLPPGYIPLPTDLVAEAKAASGAGLDAPTTTTSTTSTTSTTVRESTSAPPSSAVPPTSLLPPPVVASVAASPPVASPSSPVPAARPSPGTTLPVPPASIPRVVLPGQPIVHAASPSPGRTPNTVVGAVGLAVPVGFGFGTLAGGAAAIIEWVRRRRVETTSGQGPAAPT